MATAHDDQLFTLFARRFVREHIDSIDALELLLLLWRERTRPWDAPSLAAELRLQPAVVERLLRRLGAKSIVTRCDGATQWSGHDPAIDQVAATLAHAYESHTLEVIRVVNERSLEQAGRRTKGRVTLRNVRD